MGDWQEKGNELRSELSLRTEPLGVRRLKDAAELESIPGVIRWQQGCTFCQLPFLARVQGLTVAITGDDNALDRCMRLHGLRPVSEETMEQGAKMLATTWMPNVEEAMQQQRDYPTIPVRGATVLAPLSAPIGDPDAVLVYGNPAQVMMILCGMQKVKYECFEFQFIGEGACVDSVVKCLATGKPALAIPCYGERAMGQVTDDEIVVALPPGDVDRALQGMGILRQIGFRYPISAIGGMMDPTPLVKAIYPDG